jgi:hypothetical protein
MRFVQVSPTPECGSAPESPRLPEDPQSMDVVSRISYAFLFFNVPLTNGLGQPYDTPDAKLTGLSAFESLMEKKPSFSC